jgi:transposase
VSGYITGVERGQVVLFPEAVDDYVSGENPVRFIDAFVEQLDMKGLGFARAVPAGEGRPGYDPRVLLKLYIYGYLNRVRSSRRQERETHRNVELMWLLGRLSPDHKTIADFRKEHAKGLRAVFREFTLVCRRLDLFGRELVGVDGSKFRAVNGKERNFSGKELKKLLAKIDARIESYLADLDRADRAEAEQGVGGAETPGLAGKVEALKERREEYKRLLEDLEKSGAKQISQTDPESRSMRGGTGSQVCYNAQIAVDEKNHLIAAVEVTQEVTDVHQLSGMARSAQEALGVETLRVVADAGYHNAGEVERCLAAQITPSVPRPRTSKNRKAGLYTKEDFTYLPEPDAYRCPAQQVLPFSFEVQENGEAQRYYLNAAACKGCPLRKQCTKSKAGRRIKRWGKEFLLEEMEARLKAAPDLMRTRKSLVEHPFGTMKRGDDSGYFLLRGLEKVRGEFSLMALSYNLRRAIKLVGVPLLIAALRA